MDAAKYALSNFAAINQTLIKNNLITLLLDMLGKNRSELRKFFPHLGYRDILRDYFEQRQTPLMLSVSLLTLTSTFRFGTQGLKGQGIVNDVAGQVGPDLSDHCPSSSRLCDICAPLSSSLGKRKWYREFFSSKVKSPSRFQASDHLRG